MKKIFYICIISIILFSGCADKSSNTMDKEDFLNNERNEMHQEDIQNDFSSVRNTEDRHNVNREIETYEIKQSDFNHRETNSDSDGEKIYTIPPRPNVNITPDLNNNGADAFDRGGEDAFNFSYEWPDSLPKEIPELEGEITMLFNDPSRTRIFFDNISENEVNNYIKKLTKKGYTLQYIVYTQEGFPNNSKKRIKKGDYDAAQLTKDNYLILISLDKSDKFSEITLDITIK